MNRFRSTGLMIILTLVLSFPINTSVTAATSASDKEAVMAIKGKVMSFANPAESKSISVTLPDKRVMVFTYDDRTEFSNFTSISELKSSTVKITYRNAGPQHIATVITKAYVKLPEGVAEIRTGEVAALVQKGTEKGDYVLIDARPEKRYGEGHIPSAISIPVPKLKKHGKDILPSDKNKQLIFYCGGST